MDIVPIATLITAFATLALAGATFYYAFTNRKLMLSKEKEMERPRKKDELEHIIAPIIRQCNSEIERINENQLWIFRKIKTFYEDISKNDFKKMIYEDFILDHMPLSRTIETHEHLFHQIKENCNLILKRFNTDKYQLKIKDMLGEFNKGPKIRISETSLSSLSNTLLINIIENIDVDNNSLGVPEKSFWKIFGKELLTLRITDFKIPLGKLNTVGKQLIQINHDIISYMKKTCNEYMKDYGISLDKELKSIF